MLLIIITYLAGVLTILSPCILPVLPFVFSRSQQSFAKSGLPLLAGMCVTFSLFSALAVIGGEWISQANEWGRILAIVLLSLFGVSLIFPSLSEKFLTPLTRLGSTLGTGSAKESLWGSFILGIGTGLLWAPCAGPILGLVLTGAASQGDVSKSIGLLLAYSLGAATSLSLALVAGNKFLSTLKKFLGWDQIIKKGLGIAVLLGVVVIVFKLDRTVLTQFSKVETTSIENKLLSMIQPEKIETEAPTNSMMMMSGQNQNQPHVEGEIPELSGAVSWLNSKPLTKEDLLGKVVLVDFWTYSCINCLRTLPYVKAWAEKYKKDDFVVIGVHTPEFAFEKNIDNVKSALQELGITYPVAIDNNYKIWNAFRNQYWPAHYFIDRQGRIRQHHFGEGNYDESEKIIRELLTENGGSLSAQDTKVKAEGIQVAGTKNGKLSPETYIGYSRAKNFISSEAMKHDQEFQYIAATDLKSNQWTLDGRWFIEGEKAVLKSSKGKLRFHFHGRDLHLVLGGKKPVKFKVTLDGVEPKENHGLDVNSNGNGEIKSHRLYQLIRLKDKSLSSDHLFEIEFLNQDVEVFAFTFG